MHAITRYVTNFTYTLAILLTITSMFTLSVVALLAMPDLRAMNEKSSDIHAHEHAQAHTTPEPKQPGHQRHTYTLRTIKYHVDDTAPQSDSDDDEKITEETDTSISTNAFMKLSNAYEQYATKYQDSATTPEDLNTLRMSLRETILEATTNGADINQTVAIFHNKCCGDDDESPDNEDCYEEDEEQSALLGLTIRMGDIPTAELLLECKADVNGTDEWGSPLHAIIDLARQSDKSPYQCTNDAQTCDYASTARFLLEHKADLEKKCDSGQTPLVFAACNACPRVLTLLLDNKANVNARDHVDLTAIQYAALAKNDFALRRLLEHGADTEHLTLGTDIKFDMHEPLSFNNSFDIECRILAETRKRLPEAHEYLAPMAAQVAEEKALCTFLLSAESPLLPLLPNQSNKSNICEIVIEYATSPNIVTLEHKKITQRKHAEQAMQLFNMGMELLTLSLQALEPS